ncbi:DUF4251 domain-containing protein [Kaistella jeonii]|nr:DUF4251 domain-containing protein [Kaistella jeonii]
MTAALMIIALNSCDSQNNIAPEKVTSLLQSTEFTFMAEKANPTSYDVVNVLNSLPNSSASNILNLDYGYTVEIKKDEIKVDLPYFGTMYTPNFDSEKNSFRFTSKDFKINKTAGKKGSTVYTILTKDQQNINNIILEVYKNGKAYLSIRANDRQSISYDGYIMANKKVKK